MRHCEELEENLSFQQYAKLVVRGEVESSMFIFFDEFILLQQFINSFYSVILWIGGDSSIQ